jgi:hypothetical protein
MVMLSVVLLGAAFGGLAVLLGAAFGGPVVLLGAASARLRLRRVRNQSAAPLRGSLRKPGGVRMARC